MKNLGCILFIASLILLTIPQDITSEEPPCRIVLGDECSVAPLYGSAEMEAFVKNAIKQRRKQEFPNYDKLEREGNLFFGSEDIYIVDLNKDNLPEYFVRYQCGATGNCNFLIFSDHPPRILGDISAEYIIFEPSVNKWPDIIVYGNSCAWMGGFGPYKFIDGQYKDQPSENIEVMDGPDKTGKMVHTKSDFFKKIGPVKCECKKEK